MTPLKFKYPIFSEGVNLTVRRGDIWHERLSELPNHCIDLEDQEGNSYGKGYVIDAVKLRFSEIPERVLRHEHDPRCRTYDGLLDVMKEVYQDFSEKEPITLILFIKPKEA